MLPTGATATGLWRQAWGRRATGAYTIPGLQGGVKYEIQLRAHNDGGHGPWSQAGADEPTTVKPAAPTITSITRGDRTLAVVWSAPADTGGGVITAYDVRYIETSEDETDDANWTVRDNAWRSGDLRICHLKSHKRDGVRRTGNGPSTPRGMENGLTQRPALRCRTTYP